MTSHCTDHGLGSAPRVTHDDIQAHIISEHYFTALDGAVQAVRDQSGHAKLPLDERAFGALRLLTFCVLVLRNGFTVTGESACVSPDNFDAQVGRDVARQNAIEKIWPLLGYALKERLHVGTGAK